MTDTIGAKDAAEFREVEARWCVSAQVAHLRYSVVWPDGTRDAWCSGHAPSHLSPRMREQLREARDPKAVRRD